MNIYGEITEPKTQNSRREIDIGSGLSEKLRDLERLRTPGQSKDAVAGAGWVFCNSAGNPIDYGNFRRQWDRLHRLTGVRRRHPHTLRHLRASTLLL